MDLGEFYGGDGAKIRMAIIGSWWKWAGLPYDQKISFYLSNM